MQKLSKILIFLFLVCCALVFAFVYIFARNGVGARDWQTFELAAVSFDAHGIPTIVNNDWEKLIEAQGFVVASERMFQMDLQRRAAAGELAEIFGKKALKNDEVRWRENWTGIAVQAASDLPIEERKFCDAYARGVNQFLTDFDDRIGVEFTLLGYTPDRWKCSDTILVEMLMIDRLTGISDRELAQWQWKRHLPPEFIALLYPDQHPWNVPLFGSRSNRSNIPDRKSYLKPASVESIDASIMLYRNALFPGSNNWAYRGSEGYYLANDPHLGNSVPQVWYAQRLKVSADEWVVGFSLPGIPGVLLGMNQSISWAFTNTGEDVDDILYETLNESGDKYLEADDNGTPVWRDIESVVTKRHDGSSEIEHTARFTSRGPILGAVPGREGEVYVRQYLAFQPGVLRLPIVEVNQAKDWKSFNLAMDKFTAPAQNAVFMDRDGSFGYRLTGTGVKRQVNGRVPQHALRGKWIGLENPEQRLRKFVTKQAATSENFLATANQRIWVSQFGHAWSADDRIDRINSFLGQRSDYSGRDMEQLHLDTQSRFSMILLQWLQDHVADEGESYGNIFEEWDAWTGSSVDNIRTFDDAVQAELLLSNYILARIRDTFIPVASRNDLPKYKSFQHRSWLIEILRHPDGLEIVGLDNAEVAEKIMANLFERRTSKEQVPYPQKNRWSVQHPFEGRLPVIGELFRVEQHGQLGHPQVVNAQSPTWGPSFRAVWDMSNPRKSTWVMPLGQSGHVGSVHFKDLQSIWFEGRTLPVFPDDSGDWN